MVSSWNIPGGTGRKENVEDLPLSRQGMVLAQTSPLPRGLTLSVQASWLFPRLSLATVSGLSPPTAHFNALEAAKVLHLVGT